MARPLRIQFPDAFYHVFCRGNKRQKIFFDNDDRFCFLKVLRESLDMYHVVLYFYTLMDNHFHFGIQTKKANLSEFMRRFNISYTGWFNYRHKTCGHLFQGRYKALLIDVDNYLLALSRYIHLNPVRKSKYHNMSYLETWEYLNKYQWSSLAGYIKNKRQVDFVHYDLILEMVGGRNRYKEFVLDGLKHGVDNPFDDIQYQVILGDDIFVNHIKNQYLNNSSIDNEQPDYRKIMIDEIDPQLVIECTIKALGICYEEVLEHYGNGTFRGIVSDLLYRLSNMTEKEIGQCLGISYSAVSRLRSQLQQNMQTDKGLAGTYRNIIDIIRKQLSNLKI